MVGVNVGQRAFENDAGLTMSCVKWGGQFKVKVGDLKENRKTSRAYSISVADSARRRSVGRVAMTVTLQRLTH
jgi:hypothetical protein